MKKLAAILMLSVFLFNVIGYKLVFYFAQKQSDAKVVASLDNNAYTDDELVAIKVPVNMPYQINQGFERVDGEITLDGKIYKYVKRKVEDGQMVLMCLPDEHKTRLKHAQDDFFNQANDLANNASPKKHDGNFLMKNSLGDYDKQHADYSNLVITSKATYEAPTDVSAKTFPFHESPEQPPC